MDNEPASVLRRWDAVLGRLCPKKRAIKPRGSGRDRDGLRYWLVVPSTDTQTSKYGARLQPMGEALALLRVVRRVDARVYATEVERIVAFARQNGWYGWDLHEMVYDLASLVDERVEIALDVTVTTADDLGPVSERIFGVNPPTVDFLKDYAELETLSGHDKRARSVDGTPVRLYLHLCDLDIQQRASVVRQILQLVMAQEMIAIKKDEVNKHGGAVAAARFYISEIDFGETSLATINSEALSYLAQLCQRGIRVRSLPAIEEQKDTVSERFSIAKSLQILLFPSDDAVTTRCQPRYVQVSDHTSPHVLPAIFSAIQICTFLKYVHLRSHSEPRTLTALEARTRLLLWHCATNTLFSRDPHHYVGRVDIDAALLDGSAMVSIAKVRSSDAPFRLCSPRAGLKLNANGSRLRDFMLSTQATSTVYRTQATTLILL